MGCVCGKESSTSDGELSPKQRELIRKTSELRVARAISSKRDESFKLKDHLDHGGIRIGSIDKKLSGSRRVRDDYYEKNREKLEKVNNFLCVEKIPKALESELISAGWPAWLVAVAGEAIRGWSPRKADTFEKLDKIGQGTYSSVYKGRDLFNNKFVALKKVRFDNMDPESVKFMAREILILRNLDHPNIIKLEGLVTSSTSNSLYLVFEYMEHDLTGLASLPGVKFTEAQVKCYMQQLLSGLDYCHSHGVLHRDIKGSNLLIDNNGILKIADFGLACCFDKSQSVSLTSRVVTLWYRPPELLLGATHYGVAVDLWSAGCILGELCAGKPIMPGRTEVEQLHKIFKLCGSPSEEYWRKSKLPHSTVFKPIQPYKKRIAEMFKDVPEATLRLMETLLAVEPSARGNAASALRSDFFTTLPLACDPSTLPKYPPSKEIDAKQREEDARRQGVRGLNRDENESRRSKEMRPGPAPNANAELPRSMQQRRHVYPNSKSRSELFNSRDDESALPNDPQRPGVMNQDRIRNPPERYSHSGPLGQRKNDDSKIAPNRNDLSTLSGLVASRAFSSVESREKLGPSQVSESFGDPTRNQDQRHHSQIFAGSRNIESGRVSTKEPIMDGHGCKEKPIHFSGPLVAPSGNIDHILREHDRRIQEVARRLRQERTRAGRVRPNEAKLMSHPLYISNQNIA